MATTANETQGPTPAPQKKKTRLNPARRKSAKAQGDGQNAAATEPPSDRPKLAQNQAKAVKNENMNGQTNAPASEQSSKTAGLQKAETVLSKQQMAALTKLAAARKSNGNPNAGNTNKTNDTPKPGPLALAAPAMVTGGLAGCAAGAAVILGAGLWNKFGGADSAILAARTAKLCLDNLIEEIITSLKAGTYSAPEALDMLRRTTLAYASTIPGGAPFVERLFREIDMVRRQRGREVDKVVAEAYVDLSKAGKHGASTAELHAIVIQNLVKLSTFAEKATQDIVTRNPNLSPYRDRAVKALQPPPKTKVPTVKLNMAVQHKPTAKA
ncbi:hypothetical protein PRZ48_011053 [Zasmidium cellare]|uniref:Uncharacterized protein n=1 Tax=Zasmidium cellare TaxID=395010 RepID=A0ABR0EAC9_ZASCE|nr:hypothetical protein PRZ48_011053 [Zasmidium cellare]